MIQILAKSEFKQAKREPLLDYTAYSNEAEDLSRRIPNAKKKLSDPAWLSTRDEAALVRLTQGRCDYAIDLLTLSYSAGATITELRAFFPEVVDYFDEYALYLHAFNRSDEGARVNSPVIHLQDTEFEIANRLLCFAILLGHTKLVPRVMTLLDYNNPVRDGLLERLASLYTERPAPLPDECTRHLPYYNTLPIFEAQSPDRPALIEAYLSDWYEGSRREPYYDAHTTGSSFLGYWAWEAAAITVALGVDDQSYRDLPYYPRDLVEHLRNPATEAGEAYSIGGRRQSIGIMKKCVPVLRNAAAAGLAAAWLSVGVPAPAIAAPDHHEVKLAYGVNEVKLGTLSLRIVRGMVANGTASSFDTFTVYVMPDRAGDPWLQVTTGTPKGLGYHLRNYESGDANTQAVAFYIEGNHLFAIQATKVGPAADAAGGRKTPFEFEVVRFNENDEIPLFNSDSKRRSKGQYVDARDAIDHEFFGR